MGGGVVAPGGGGAGGGAAGGGGIFTSAPHSAIPTVSAIAMTPSKSSTNVSADSSESRYKRLFHQKASKLLGRNRESRISVGQSTADQEPKIMNRDWALEIDIPTGTRTRGKRKESKDG